MKEIFNSALFLLLLLKSSLLITKPYSMNKLTRYCRTIKDTIIAMHDYRTPIKDQIETSITLYLLSINTDESLQLLVDLKSSNFDLQDEASLIN